MMMVQQEEAVKVSVHDYHIRIERTTIIGCRAFFSIGLFLIVTTRRIAFHLARGS